MHSEQAVLDSGALIVVVRILADCTRYRASNSVSNWDMQHAPFKKVPVQTAAHACGVGGGVRFSRGASRDPGPPRDVVPRDAIHDVGVPEVVVPAESVFVEITRNGRVPVLRAGAERGFERACV
jgi:hypothetical protein